MRVLATLLAVLLACARPGLALDPATPLTGYGHDVWVEAQETLLDVLKKATFKKLSDSLAARMEK